MKTLGHLSEKQAAKRVHASDTFCRGILSTCGMKLKGLVVQTTFSGEKGARSQFLLMSCEIYWSS